ncbi:MAG: hypothetical protein ACRBFS_00200 [Aureispira sp.]
MGLFDFFKKNKNTPAQESTPVEKQTTPQKESSEELIHEVAYASIKYTEVNKDYPLYKKELLSFGMDDEKIVFSTIGTILRFYYASQKEDTLKLYQELHKDYPDNEDITWLFIEVICTINIENDQVFVEKYLNHKRLQHDFNHHYQTEYQKGLELKSKHYFKEAIALWTSLNKLQEFSWNYYQIGILQNLLGEEQCLQNLKKGIEMDAEIKEDAQSYPELDNLRTNPIFLKMLE